LKPHHETEKEKVAKLLKKQATDFKLTKTTKWPPIKVGPHQKVVGKASDEIKKFCGLIREIEKVIRRLKKIHDSFPCQQSAGKDEFYNELIAPLEDRAFVLVSEMKLELSMEFPKLMGKNDIGVGQKGQAFYFDIPGQDNTNSSYGQFLFDLGVKEK